MNQKYVYLTFKTDERTAALLKFIAKGCNKTQPELINEICKNFIEDINETARITLEEKGEITAKD